MIDCYCDGAYDADPPSFFREKEVVGRKEHRCYECHRPILTGERHTYMVGSWGGDFSDFRVCAQCRSIAQDLLCDMWMYGEMWETIHEVFCDSYDGCLCPNRGW